MRDEPLDVVAVGNGFVSRFTVGHIADTRKVAPKALRVNQQSADGNVNMAIVGPSLEDVGRAYGPRGYASWDAKHHQVNLQDYLMEFNCGKRPPIDAELYKITLDIEERRLRGQRPVRFAKPYTNPENNIRYTLDSEYRNPHSLEKFNSAQRFLHPNSYSGKNVSRETFRRYVIHTVEKIVARSKRVNVRGIEGEVTRIDYDEQKQLFTLTVKKAGSDKTEQLTARRVVLGTGQERDFVPDVLKGIVHDARFYSGDDVYDRLLSEAHANPAQMQNRRGLLVGTGLTMNDVAKSLLRLKVGNFHIISRHVLTHELPQDMPPLEQCLGRDYEPLLENLDRIHDRLNPDQVHPASFNGRGDIVDRYVGKVKETFLSAKSLADSYEPSSDEPLIIRGQPFDRKLVCRALLAQYAAYRYEGLRGGLFRERYGEETANEIVERLFREIDEPYSAWITTSHTSNTDANIKVNRWLRESGKLEATSITGVKKVGERFDVSFANGKTERFDYIANFAGRRQVPVFDPKENENDQLTTSLIEQGLIQPHPTGIGAKMDETGRAVPDPRRLGNGPTPNLFLASALARGELMFPTNPDRDPLGHVISQAAPGLEPLTKQIADSIVLDMTGWKPHADHELDFEYTEAGVNPVPRR
ncbi:FAD/NAD(P)-binding protein [Paraburkholderia sp.]|uniref:FAD/NAD(P)-binding protein n=1 Tax=Paraburkholderia sp. TaxID=1926495 RepID=UPI003D6F35C1